MKVKKVAIGVFLASVLVALFSINAHAAEAFYTCTIDRLGGANNVTPLAIYVMLSDTKASPTFTRKYFRIPNTNLNQTMAVFLTALSSNIPVTVWVDPDLANSNDRLIKQVYLEVP